MDKLHITQNDYGYWMLSFDLRSRHARTYKKLSPRPNLALIYNCRPGQAGEWR